MKYIRIFLKRFIADWLTILCGPLALPLTAYGVYVSTNTYNRLLFTLVLIIGLTISSYRVWEKEYLKTLEAEFPIVEFNRATLFSIKQNDIPVAQYVALPHLIITNRNIDKPISVSLKFIIKAGTPPFRTEVIHGSENEPIPNWRDLAQLHHVGTSTQLSFPLTIPPSSSIGGCAIFLLSRNKKDGLGLRFLKRKDGTRDCYIRVKELVSGDERIFPLDIIDRYDANGEIEWMYVRGDETRAT